MGQTCVQFDIADESRHFSVVRPASPACRMPARPRSGHCDRLGAPTCRAQQAATTERPTEAADLGWSGLIAQVRGESSDELGTGVEGADLAGRLGKHAMRRGPRLWGRRRRADRGPWLVLCRRVVRRPSTSVLLGRADHPCGLDDRTSRSVLERVDGAEPVRVIDHRCPEHEHCVHDRVSVTAQVFGDLAYPIGRDDRPEPWPTGRYDQ